MKLNRPLSPHLNVYKPQLTSTLSIFHRISGALLAITLLFTVFSFKVCDLSLNYYPIYLLFYSGMTNLHWFFFSLLNVTLLAFCYHISNGIRHLLWDFGFFLDLSKVYATGTIMILCSILLFILLCILRVSNF
jgi:succinate dehydrogenase / fumarate reductase cytochrome b subunit